MYGIFLQSLIGGGAYIVNCPVMTGLGVAEYPTVQKYIVLDYSASMMIGASRSTPEECYQCWVHASTRLPS